MRGTSLKLRLFELPGLPNGVTGMIEELRRLIARHAGLERIPVEGLQLASVDAPTAPISSIVRPVLAVVAQGSKRLVFGDRVFEYGAGDYLVVSLDLPVSGQFVEASRERPFLGIGLDLRPEVIASLLLDDSLKRYLPTVPGPLRSSSIAVSPASAHLLDAVVRLVRLIDRPGDRQVLAPLIEREIAWLLLTGSQSAVVRQIGLADSSLAYVVRAIRWIRDHPAEAFRVEDLAEQASMSVSTFHRHFRAVTTMSPVQYQKRVRLQQARLLLMGEGFDVAGAGLAVGYDSPSQFSREYRREYGAPPGQDAARRRINNAGTAVTGLP